MILISFRSSFSLLIGLHTPGEISRIARENGYSSVLIADTNNLYGLAEIMRLKREKENNVHAGVILNLPHTNRMVQLLAIPVTTKGFSNIFTIVSEINISKEIKQRDIFELIQNRTDGLIFITTDLRSIRLLKEISDQIFFGINIKNVNIYPIVRSEGLRTVILQDVIFRSKEEIPAGIILRCIAEKKRFDELRDLQSVLKDSILVPAQILKERFSHITDAFDNMEYIESLLQRTKFNPPMILPGSDIRDANKKLETLAFEGAKRRYPEITEEIRSRLRYELDIICQKGYAGYFLLVKDIVDQAKITCGRGSAAASLVSYCLNITNVDPIRHNLMFERFLNPLRSDPPDIDIDFPWDEREVIINYIFRKYNGRVAQVSNHNTLSDRLVIREVARSFGFTESEINYLVKIISPLLEHPEDILDNKSNSILREGNIKNILRIARMIYNNMRHISTHCGGIVISPSDIRETAPVEITGGGRYVIQWDKDDIEEFNIVKIDILGNRSLSVIRDAKEMIKNNYGIDIDKRFICFDKDPATIDLIKKGKTIGVFYIESPAMRQLQQKTDIADFEHIVIHSSIIRPAANRYINEYVDRLKGKPYQPLHPALSNLLSETYGIMCYQEDVMKVAISIAGFSYEEADRLRKTLSKKHRASKIQHYKEKFFEGGRKNGVNEGILSEIWAMIESFGGYSFCKPHSASYAQVSFNSAYIKAHFPAEFVASVIKNRGGYYSTFAYISEARRMGIKVHPPEINISSVGAYGIGDSIWLGFEDIISLKKETIEKVIIERGKNGNYISLRDFLKRNPDIEFAEIRKIILSGSFRKIEQKQNRARLLFGAEIHIKRGRGSLINRLIDDKCLIPDYTFEQYIKYEFEIFGFPLSIHPLRLAEHLPDPPERIFAKDTKKDTGRYVKMAGVLITAKPIITRSDEMMEFLTFEDETDIFEVVLFPRAFKNNHKKLTTMGIFLLEGKIENDRGAIYLNCIKIEPLKDIF